MTQPSVDRRKTTISITIVVACLGLAAAIVFSPSRGGRAVGPDQQWFYDLKTGELFAAEPRGMPPIDAPGGGPGMGALAHVYACGACTESNRVIIAVETLSDAARRVQEQLARDHTSVPPQEASAALATGRLLAAPAKGGADLHWVVATSPEGYALLDKVASLCDGQPATLCTP